MKLACQSQDSLITLAKQNKWDELKALLKSGSGSKDVNEKDDVRSFSMHLFALVVIHLWSIAAHLSIWLLVKVKIPLSHSSWREELRLIVRKRSPYPSLILSSPLSLSLSLSLCRVGGHLSIWLPGRVKNPQSPSSWREELGLIFRIMFPPRLASLHLISSLQTHQTPLHMASMRGHAVVVSLLLEKGAEINLQNTVLLSHLPSSFHLISPP
jgi:hypothetical protein